MGNNWIVENIQNALDTWNDKLNEIWRLLSQSPAEFKGGTVCSLSDDDLEWVSAAGEETDLKDKKDRKEDE